MNNIISSDYYRVRHGWTLRGTFIGVVLVIIVVMGIILGVQSAQFGTDTTDMTAAEIAEMQQDAADAQEEMGSIDSGAAFGLQMLGQFLIPFFFLPVILAVFCADFSAGTYRNTLSFESNRTKVYFSKLLLSVGICLAMVLGMLGVSWLVGGIAFGFGGFSTAYFGKVFTVLLLQLPIYLSYIAVGHFLVAVTKKSSTTIAIFLIGYFAVAIVLQTVAESDASREWMQLLDPTTSGQIMVSYEAMQIKDILFVVLYNIGIIGVTTLIGVTHYRKADMP